MDWYCISTTTLKERVAAARLDGFGVETFAPQTQKFISNGHGGGSYRSWPLYPGYLFARCELSRYSLAASQSRKEILRLIDFGSGPAVVDEFLIEEIKSRIGPDGFIWLDDALKIGGQVRITSGVFEGQVGLFHADEQRRVVVMLELLGKRFPRVFERHEIAPVMLT
jgi:transcription antitermination factor NusG